MQGSVRKELPGSSQTQRRRNIAIVPKTGLIVKSANIASNPATGLGSAVITSHEDPDIYGVDRTYRTVRNDGSSLHPLRHSKDSLESTPKDGQPIRTEERRDTWYRRSAGMTNRVGTEQRTSKVKDSSRSRHNRVDIESGVDGQKNATIKLASED